MAQGGESGVWGLRARGLMLLPASFATLGKSPPPSELQPPVPCHEGGWTSCQRDIESAPGWEEGHGERTPKAGRSEAGASSGLCELLGCQRLAGEWPRRGS